MLYEAKRFLNSLLSRGVDEELTLDQIDIHFYENVFNSKFWLYNIKMYLFEIQHIKCNSLF